MRKRFKAVNEYLCCRKKIQESTIVTIGVETKYHQYPDNFELSKWDNFHDKIHRKLYYSLNNIIIAIIVAIINVIINVIINIKNPPI
jgi:hypothetical protein